MSYVLITGASSGIGEEFALQYAKKGKNLILVARREERLTEIKDRIRSSSDVDVCLLPFDVTANAEEIYRYCTENDKDVEILINNAGFGSFGTFLNDDIENDMAMIELNVKALTKLCYLFAENMKKRGSGHILNVGSVASFIPGPYMGVYYGTKSYVLSFSLALREELRKEGIGVSVLCPAPTKTAFWDVANGKTSLVYRLFSRTAKDAVKTGIRIIENNRPYQIDGMIYRISIGILRLLPPSISAYVMGVIQSKTKE